MDKYSSKQKINNKYALLSVFDKTGVVDFAKFLASLGYAIISTGGTAKILTDNGVSIIPIQEITGNPESFDGRMKTISFQVESGILFDRKNPTHVQEMKNLQFKPIDVVVCNLYPFEQTIQKPKLSFHEAIENIDVGGPTMIRAAAKNFSHVVVVIDPNDYQEVSNHLKNNALTDKVRQQLAAKAFFHLSLYDSQIARFFSSDMFPNEITIPARKKMELRYGENPHQKAAIYFDPVNKSSLKNLKKRAGRELSFVNVTDIYAGIESVRLFKEPAVVVIKHNTPCGIALGKTSKTALQRAIDADPESAFGGVIVLNCPMNLEAAKVITVFKDEKHSNIDIVAAPSITEEALELLRKLRKSMGIYTFDDFSSPSVLQIKWINEGFILQTADIDIENSFAQWKVVTDCKPTEKQLDQMKIAWKFISRIRSNAVIVVDKNLPMTRGIGTGQTSRIRSTKIALEQAGIHGKHAILASDSFFPFDDSVKLASKFEIGAIVQQGGSVNDKLSIAVANELNIPMVFTGRRAFWH